MVLVLMRDLGEGLNYPELLLLSLLLAEINL